MQAVASVIAPKKGTKLLRGMGVACLVAGVFLYMGPAAGQAQTTVPQAQSAVPQAPAGAPTVQLAEVVVTNTLIRGYNAPTPMTVLGGEQIGVSSPVNIANLVEQLPALGTSLNPTTQGGQISSGASGINTLNLRNLGDSRTLVLLDGQRIPAATLEGDVDINTLPNALIERVEVVTGGASATWGSDAVAGVVNFVLDKKFTGLKGEVQGGESTFGDDPTAKVSLTGGTGFDHGRGHVLLSVEDAYSGGINGYPRPWYTGAKLMDNPAYTSTDGQPYYLVERDTGFTTVAPGAIVASGPLSGLYFGQNGAPGQLNYGPIVKSPYMVGGDWKYTDFGDGPQDLAPMISRQNIFGYASYDVTDKVQVHVEVMYGKAYTSFNSTPQFYFGGITINRDNAYLPQSVVDSMTALGLTSLNVGTWNADLGGVLTQTTRQQYRYEVGANGDFGMLGSDWKWGVSIDRNVSDFVDSAFPIVKARYTQAINAVVGPTGAIVCESTLTDPNNGCVPYDILGTGTASAAARAYVTGNTWLRSTLTQDIISANVNGSPFSIWAGPVSLAVGMDYRNEYIDGTTDPLSATASYWAGNYKPLVGSDSVTEGFAETVVPLIRHKLNADLAARATDYSTSGYVTTWKGGLNFSPVHDILFRLSRSLDIRAPNLDELYSRSQPSTSAIDDPFQNNVSTTYFNLTSGNPNLKPEKADTLTYGVVLNPRFVQNLRVSADFFDIKINDAIATLSAGTILDECYDGNQLLCSQVERDASGVLTAINVGPLNFESEKVRGIDFELDYSTALWGGDLSIGGTASHYLQDELSSGGISAPVNYLGATAAIYDGIPYWKYRIQAIYQKDRITLSATGRGLSAGVYDPNYIACTTNCPAYTSAHPTINTNHVGGVFYTDFSALYEVRHGVKLELAIDNLANRAPPIAARGTSVGSAPLDTIGYYYDMIGRVFRAGVRFQF